MAFEEKDVYAALGMEVPAKQPEAADPASQGANDPSPAGTDGREDQATGNREQATGDAGDGFFDSGSADSQNDMNGTGNGGRGFFDSGSADPQNDRNETSEESRGASKAPPPTASDSGQERGEPSAGQTRAERAEQARLRREREQKAAVNAAVREERQKNEAAMKAMFEAAGMVDRYHDNKPITSLEEFNAFQAARQADKLNRELQNGKLTPESFQAAVDNSPAVREARETVERLKAREKAETEAARKAEFDARVKDELAEIHRLNPAVNNLEDILAMQTAGEFTRLVRDKGMSFLEAFKLANLDDIIEGQAAAAAEGAARQRHGKDHLRSINAGGQVTVDVPPDVIANYRMFQPDMSLEEIQRDYAKRYGK